MIRPHLAHHDRVLIWVADLLPAGRAPDVFRQHLGCLGAEPAEQPVRARGDPYGEALWIVLAEFKVADPRQ